MELSLPFLTSLVGSDVGFRTPDLPYARRYVMFVYFTTRSITMFPPLAAKGGKIGLYSAFKQGGIFLTFHTCCDTGPLFSRDDPIEIKSHCMAKRVVEDLLKPGLPRE